MGGFAERATSSTGVEALGAELSEATLNSLNTGAIDMHGNFSERWERTLRQVVQAIVSIRVNVVRSFDTERATSTQATGFVVDVERGLILTNRHVVTAGPITAEAIFHNHEEVPVYPVYRDPIHDFGFLRFDVTRLRYQKIVAIPIAPELARVGIEIRVVGNDAGEKLSILAGTLARLDRAAPKYGVGQYNDFNTFYYQAASGTSGGSSGSPVLDVYGNAIAINAGGLRKAASSFYLPLDRVARALRLLQKGQPVTRGTLQCEFLHEGFDEVRRLGLPSAKERIVRDQFGGNGMLVVSQVMPGGPAAGHLIPGDILLSVNDVITVDFTRLADVMDSNVDGSIKVEVQRGETCVVIMLKVQDLHAIMPSRFLTVSGAVVHSLSYQMARGYTVPTGGVYLASAGYMFNMAGIQRGAIITHMAGKPTPDLDAFIEALQSIPGKMRVPVRSFNLSDIYRERVCIVQMDRHWHASEVYSRNDITGVWDKMTLPPPTSFYVPQPSSANFPRVSGPASVLAASLVTIQFHVPYQIDGVHGSNFLGTGVIVDAERGLVVIDASTVPIYVGDLTVVIARSVNIPGRIVYQHALHNYVVIAYDPTLVGNTAVRAAVLSDRLLVQGDEVILIGLSKEQRVVSRTTNVTEIRELLLTECKPPRFRAINVEGIEVDDPLDCDGGVLADPIDGTVRALWMSYSFQDADGNDKQFSSGLQLDVVLPVIKELRAGRLPLIRSLGVEMWPTAIADARSLGLSQTWIDRIEEFDPTRRQVIGVRRITTMPSSTAALKEGDIILMVNGKLATSFRHVDGDIAGTSVTLHILRDGVEQVVEAPTSVLPAHSTSRLVGWAGVVLQEPHLSVYQQRRELPGRVYSSWWYNGSPAHLYNLRATVWITEVNDRPVPDLDAFLAAIKDWEEANAQTMSDELAHEYVRLKTVDFSNRVRVITLKPDNHYWPLWELRHDDTEASGWNYVSHSTALPTTPR